MIVTKCDICGGLYPYSSRPRDDQRRIWEQVGFRVTLASVTTGHNMDICDDCVKNLVKHIETMKNNTNGGTDNE